MRPAFYLWFCLATLAAPAWADLQVSTASPDSCPSVGAVAQALDELLPDAHADLTIEVIDSGIQYQLRLGASEWQLVDEQRDCNARARAIAAVVALALDPPRAPAPPPPPPPPVQPPPSLAKPVLGPKALYPQAFGARPLLLPFKMAEIQSALLVFSRESLTGPQHGEALQLGFDVGVAKRVQVGLSLTLPFNPGMAFSNLTTRLLVSLHSSLALRFEAALEGWNVLGVDVLGGSFAVALPGKWRLHDKLWLTVGGAGVRSSWIETYSSRTTPSAYGNRSGGSSLNLLSLGFLGEVLLGSFAMPVGLIIQPLPRLALVLQSGARLTFSRGTAPNHNYVYYWAIPLAFDMVVTPIRPLDIGLSIELPGFVQWYGEQRFMSAWIRGRF